MHVGDLTRPCSVPELIAASRAYLRHDDANTGPFVWNTNLDALLERVANR